MFGLFKSKTPTQIALVYTDASGRTSERTISLLRVWPDEGLARFLSHCHLCDDLREFRSDRIVKMHAPRAITAPTDWLFAHPAAISRAQSDATMRALQTYAAESTILTYAAHCDEAQVEEFEAIAAAMAKQTGEMVDIPLAIAMLRRLEPDMSDVKAAISEIRREDARETAFIEALHAVARADGVITREEETFSGKLEKIVDKLAGKTPKKRPHEA